VQKFAKPILIAVGAAAILAALAILGANLYLQSNGVQSRIREAASQATGMPLQIRGTSFTPWSGVSVSGITVPKSAGGTTPLLDVQAIHVGFRFLPLLRGKIVISDILLTEPTITSVQRPDGSWEQPQTYKGTELPDPGPPAPGNAAPVAVASPSGDGGSASPKQVGQPVEIERLRVRNGRSHFYDSKGVLVMALEKISVDARIPADGPATGTFKIEETTLGGFLHPRKVSGHFSWANGTLDIPDLSARWAGGNLTASFRLEPNPANRFSATIDAGNVALKKLAEDAGMVGEGKRGHLFLQARLAGSPGHPDSISGNASVSLKDARVQPLDFIRQVGDLLQIEELQMLQLKTAEAAFTIRDEKVVADRIVLESENLVITAEGTTSFEGKLKLRARLLVNEKLRRESRGLLGSNFEKSDRDGYTQMPFAITGSLARPKTDLLEKLVGIRIGQDLGGLLKNLFRAPAPKPRNDTENTPPAGGQNGL